MRSPRLFCDSDSICTRADARARLLRLLTDVSENTTVDIEHVAIDGVRSMGCEEHSRPPEFRRIEPATCRCLGTDERIDRMTAAVGLTLTERSRLRGCDIARADTITLDVVLTILRADVTSQHLQTALGSCVC